MLPSALIAAGLTFAYLGARYPGLPLEVTINMGDEAGDAGHAHSDHTMKATDVVPSKTPGQLEHRVISAFGFSAFAALFASRRGSLSRSGVLGALLVGTLAIGFGGWTWGLLLGLFFVSSSLLSHYKKRDKQVAAEKFDKGHRRDFAQALANGGAGAGAALLSQILPSSVWFSFFLGATATANADTWATELGTLSKRPPRLITTGRLTAVGTSGAVSALGTLMSFLGGALIGLGAGLARHRRNPGRALITGGLAGLAGSLFDSLLGATIQQIFYCDYCKKDTERKIHKCGHTTRPLRGWSWLNNDLVNLFASIMGGLIAVVLWRLLGSIGKSEQLRHDAGKSTLR